MGGVHGRSQVYAPSREIESIVNEEPIRALVDKGVLGLVFKKLHGGQSLGLWGLIPRREDSRDFHGEMPAAPRGKMVGERRQDAPSLLVGCRVALWFHPSTLGW